jgi:hypothetical protein
MSLDDRSVTWPALPNDSCPHEADGLRMDRGNEQGAAVAIERYEFRTTGRFLQGPT